MCIHACRKLNAGSRLTCLNALSFRERNRLWQLKLQTLSHALEDSKAVQSVSVRGKQVVIKKDPHKAKDLDRVIEKLRIFQKLVQILTRKSDALEGKCMQLEEQSLRQTQEVNEKLRLLSECTFVSHISSCCSVY